MGTQPLLDYIRQNLAAGLARADIEKALFAAGWAAQDITDGFNAIENPGVAMPPSAIRAPAPHVSGPVVSANDNAAEVARILHEVELEAKRQKWRGSTTSTPVVGGIIGWLIAKKIVEEESQANIALLCVAVIAILHVVGIYLWSSSPPNRPSLTPQQVEQKIKATIP